MPKRKKPLTAKQVRSANRSIRSIEREFASKPYAHQWLKDRDMKRAYIVLRIDDYGTDPEQRGQFYPDMPRSDDSQKAIWPSYELALSAAKWAAEKFKKQYGVFSMGAIVEPAHAPINVVKV